MIPELTYPWALLLLLLLPGLAWRYVRHSRGAWQFSDHRILPARMTLRARMARWGGVVLRLVGVLLVIVALTGPRWVDERDRIPTDGISIAMIVDVRSEEHTSE